jgi:hypothetical protein
MGRTAHARTPADVVEVARTVDRDADADVEALEQLDVAVVDENAVGLDRVSPVTLEPPRPELFDVFLWQKQRLAPKQRERPALSLDRGLHQLHVVAATDVPGVALRVLVAVLALDVASNAQRSQLYAHVSLPPGSSFATRKQDHTGAQMRTRRWPQVRASAAERRSRLAGD